MLVLASYLAENTRPTYERVAARLTARLGEPAFLLGGVAWEERLRAIQPLLDTRRRGRSGYSHGQATNR
jgi:hypothetical protein